MGLDRPPQRSYPARRQIIEVSVSAEFPRNTPDVSYRAPTILMAFVTLGLAGCGDGGSKSADAASTTPETCVILANGNKLCGADAKAWCEKFVSDGQAPDSEEACRKTGANLLTEEGLAAEQQALDDETREFDRGRALLSVDEYQQVAERIAGDDHVYLAEPTPSGNVKIGVDWGQDGYDPPPAGMITRLCRALDKIEPGTVVHIEPVSGKNWRCDRLLAR